MDKKNVNKANDMDDKSKKFRRAPKKKVCAFCVEKVEEIDYKDVTRLKRFTTEKGKIVPRRASGVRRASASALHRNQARSRYSFPPLQGRVIAAEAGLTDRFFPFRESEK